VLVVDDHPVVRTGVRSLLADAADVEVVGEACDGRQAIAAAERHNPDVVLMDLRMPDLGGVEATRRILEARPGTAVVILTGPNAEDDVVAALEAGALGYLAKSAPRSDFLAALDLEPDQPLVMNYLAYSWVEQKQNLERAQEMLRRAVELRPSDGYIVDSLGWVYYRLGKYEQAVGELERAVELRPQDPTINDHLGDAYWRVGREREARFQWLRALGLEPGEEETPVIEQKLEEGLTGEPKDI